MDFIRILGDIDEQGNPKMFDGAQEMNLVQVTFEYENMNEENLAMQQNAADMTVIYGWTYSK